MNRHSIDDPTQVGCAKQRPTVFVGTVCDYLDSFTLPVNPVSFFLFSPLFLLETVGNLLKHCPMGPSGSGMPCWRRLTWWQCRGTFGTGAFPMSATDRWVPAVLAVSAGRFFLPP